MTLGSTIRALRNSAGLSQRQLAEAVRISPAYLSQIESDKREATIPLLRRMAQELGSPAVVLFATAIASKLPKDGREREMAVIQQLVDAVQLNIQSKQLSFGLRDAS